MESAKIEKIKCDILGDFQTNTIFGMRHFRSFSNTVHIPFFTDVGCDDLRYFEHSHNFLNGDYGSGLIHQNK